MSSMLVSDLRQRLLDKRVVLVAGSGVTAAATRGHALASWSGFVTSGVERAANLPGVQQGCLDAARSLLNVGDCNALVTAAELVTEALGGRDNGEYALWLRETIGSLELADPSVPAALGALGVPVATTNYDGLIEQATEWERVTWLDGAAMQRALQGDEQAVVHLHGHWFTAQSVILGIRSYDELAVSGAAQGLQRAMATMNSLLFVGVGDGASDPNFLALRKWLAATFQGSEYRHYRLCLNSELDTLSAEHRHEERIVPLGYGDSHDQLADFLHSLATAPRPAAASANSEETGTRTATRLPARPVTIGRDEEIAEVVAQLLAEPPQPTLLHGAPGIGKTNLTLAALYSTEAIERFGARRWLVRCEPLVSAAGLASELAAAVGVLPSGDIRAGADTRAAADARTGGGVRAGGDVLGGLIARLSEAPAIVALDNLETPWERDTLAVEELLGMVAAVPRVALIASLRGTERPGGVRWARSTQLEPLQPRAAKNLFLSIAPAQFDAPGLGDLLEEMGGIPLAIELLAHAAEGESTLAGLTERWRAERVRLLTRGTADHRLLSIAVSIDISWNSPTMTDSARRLLSLLGELPDGIAGDDLEILLPGEGPAAANQLRRRGIALDRAGRLCTLPPVRHHLADAHPPSASDWQRTIAHYGQLAETLGVLAGHAGGADAISKLSSETANIVIAITAALSGEQSAQGQAAGRAFINAARFSGIDAAPIADALVLAAERSADAATLAEAVTQVGHIALAASDHEGARKSYERALPLYQEAGNRLGEANCILCLGDIALARSDHETARGAYERALPIYHEIEDILGEANCVKRVGDLALRHSDHDTARDAYQRALPLYHKIADTLGEANCIKRVGDIELERFNHEAARSAYEEAMPLYRQLGAILGEANCIQGLGDVALRSDYEAAREAYQRALPLYRQVGDVLGEANCIMSVGDIAQRKSEDDAAREAFLQALPLFQQVGDVLGEANCIQGLGDLSLTSTDHYAARDAYQRALVLYTKIDEPYSIGRARRRLARLTADPAARREHVSEARAAWSRIGRDDLMDELAAEFADCN